MVDEVVPQHDFKPGEIPLITSKTNSIAVEPANPDHGPSEQGLHGRAFLQLLGEFGT